jgi:large subunit ribosomal protein L23
MTTEEKAVAKKTVKKSLKTTKKASVGETVAPKSISRFAADVFIAPLVTEKTAGLSTKNVLVFRVAQRATRVAVKQAMKELYGVVPVKVNMVTVRPRAMRFGRTQGKTKGYKKAMVTLPAGKTIDVFAS